MFRSVSPLVGHQRIGVSGLPDAVARHPTGLVAFFVDEYWGGAEMIYVQANGAVRQGALVAITPVLVSGVLVYQAAEVPNTANLGKALQIAMTVMTTGQYGWAMVSGCAPVNCTASVAADTAFGIAGAGQGGAVANGKQIVGGRIALPATTTVAKANCVANSGSLQLTVPNSNGWFCGAYLSGTGIAANTTVVDIDPTGTVVTLSLATTAAVSGTVTATYNNGTVYYNVAHINTPVAQGQVT